jgi:toxin ParE1/3/4
VSGFRLAPDVEAELDAIWLYVARGSGSIDTANHLADQISEHFWQLAQHPYIGRTRNDWRPGLRSFPVDDYLIIYRIIEGDTVLILHVVHGRRDIGALFSS